MSVLPKVLGLTVAGVLVIALYLSTSVVGSLFFGAVSAPSTANPLSFMIYVGLALTATFVCLIMYLASTGGEEA
ncbi:hypothetical protein [Magnetospirillum sulfuroxidans]|uniref:Uncharacterized protein n=1 Tax=Magnetospirillum sulfuroxidans TaxID=611300 RepID=A0ABS5ICV2_9PROT|nr:hypothetical protein [Magnetospirillum sulfuroxidans]MBR9972254.1 hypothetical protein [Magnetospirillum sulfuroxidans]